MLVYLEKETPFKKKDKGYLKSKVLFLVIDFCFKRISSH